MDPLLNVPEPPTATDLENKDHIAEIRRWSMSGPLLQLGTRYQGSWGGGHRNLNVSHHGPYQQHTTTRIISVSKE